MSNEPEDELPPDSPTRHGPETLAALILAAVLPVVYAPGLTHTLVARDAVLGVGGAVVLLLWTISVRTDTLSIRGRGLLAALIALAGLAATSAAWAVQPDRVVPAAGAWLAVGALALVVLAPSGRPVSLRSLSLSLAGGCLVAGAMTCLRLMGLAFLPAENTAPGLDIWFVTDQVSVAAIAVPLFLAAALRYDGPTRWAVGLGLLSALVSLGVASDPLVLVSLGVGLGITLACMVLVRARPTITARFGLSALAVGGIVFLASLATPGEVTPLPGEPASARFDHLVRGMDESELAGERLLVAALEDHVPSRPDGDGARGFLRKTAFASLGENPIAGRGAGSATHLIERHRVLDDGWFSAQLEPLPAFASFGSAFLDVLTELGLVGAALLALIFSIPAVQGLRALRLCSEDEPLEITLAGVFAAFATALALAVLSPLNRLPGSLAATGLVLGALTALSDRLLDGGLGLGRVEIEPHESRSSWMVPALVALLILTGLTISHVSNVRADWRLQWGDLYTAGAIDAAPAKALEQYDHAVAIDADNVSAHTMRGLILSKRRDFDAAVSAFDRALEIRRSDEIAMLGRARALYRGQKMRRARKAYVSIVESNPNLVSAHVELANVELSLGAVDRAAARLVAALGLDPSPEARARIHTLMGQVLLQDDRVDEAERHLDRAREIAKPRGIHVQLGGLYESIDRKRSVREALERGQKPPSMQHIEQHPLGEEHGHGHGHDPSNPNEHGDDHGHADDGAHGEKGGNDRPPAPTEGEQ